MNELTTTYELPSTLDAEIDDYERLVEDYRAGKLEKARMKVVRVPMGVYEQRTPETYMVRVRLPGGAITPAQLRRVAEIAEKYSPKPLHFTTRQDVQLHDLKLEDTVKVLRELRQVGLSSRGGGGNTVRNVLGSYDAGVAPDEVFDVTPHVRALTSRLIAEPDSWTLPRKLKIAFSCSPRDSGLATFNDLGFVAKLGPNGERGFSVHVAGGMGSKPAVAHPWLDFIEESEVYVVAKAVKNLFDKRGNRKNKHRARLRFLFWSLGEEEFFRALNEELENARSAGFPPLDLSRVEDKGRGHFEIPLFLGDLPVNRAKILAGELDKFGEECCRVTPTQNLLVRGLPEGEVGPLEKRLREAGVLRPVKPPMHQAVACAGASTCKLGICLSRNLLAAIREQLERTDYNAHRVKDLRVKVSGCPNTCGHHVTADLGLFGVARRKHNRMAPYFNVLLGGVVREGASRLAQRVGEIPAKRAPRFVAEFFQFVAENRLEGEGFVEFLERVGRAKAEELLEKYSEAPDPKEDEDFYRDWGSDEPFSLAGKVEGECSAGLFDLIDLELSQASLALEEAAGAKDPARAARLAGQAVLASAKALLVTKGLEPGSDAEAAVLFKQHFVGQHLDPSFGSTIDAYLRGEAVGLEAAQSLLDAVRGLYEAMDNSLRFPSWQAGGAAAAGHGGVVRKTRFKDLRGVKCPLNYVKAKLLLEEMDVGDHLEILLDDGEPIDNVPKSLASDGQEILVQERVGEHWRLVVEKKK
ncbi:MAG: hypothetical protein Kow0069_30210 [Promethearchaeota archaeon]